MTTQWTATAAQSDGGSLPRYILEQGGLIYTTTSDMNADLAHDADSLAWVAGSNSVYIKTGDTGGGAWTLLWDLTALSAAAEEIAVNGDLQDIRLAPNVIRAQDAPYLVSADGTTDETVRMTLVQNAANILGAALAAANSTATHAVVLPPGKIRTSGFTLTLNYSTTVLCAEGDVVLWNDTAVTTTSATPGIQMGQSAKLTLRNVYFETSATFYGGSGHGDHYFSSNFNNKTAWGENVSNTHAAILSFDGGLDIAHSGTVANSSGESYFNFSRTTGGGQFYRSSLTSGTAPTKTQLKLNAVDNLADPSTYIGKIISLSADIRSSTYDNVVSGGASDFIALTSGVAPTTTTLKLNTTHNKAANWYIGYRVYITNSNGDCDTTPKAVTASSTDGTYTTITFDALSSIGTGAAGTYSYYLLVAPWGDYTTITNATTDGTYTTLTFDALVNPGKLSSNTLYAYTICDFDKRPDISFRDIVLDGVDFGFIYTMVDTFDGDIINAKRILYRDGRDEHITYGNNDSGRGVRRCRRAFLRNVWGNGCTNKGMFIKFRNHEKVVVENVFMVGGIGGVHIEAVPDWTVRNVTCIDVGVDEDGVPIPKRPCAINIADCGPGLAENFFMSIDPGYVVANVSHSETDPALVALRTDLDYLPQLVTTSFENYAKNVPGNKGAVRAGECRDQTFRNGRMTVRGDVDFYDLISIGVQSDNDEGDGSSGLMYDVVVDNVETVSNGVTFGTNTPRVFAKYADGITIKRLRSDRTIAINSTTQTDHLTIDATEPDSAVYSITTVPTNTNWLLAENSYYNDGDRSGDRTINYRAGRNQRIRCGASGIYTITGFPTTVSGARRPEFYLDIVFNGGRTVTLANAASNLFYRGNGTGDPATSPTFTGKNETIRFRFWIDPSDSTYHYQIVANRAYRATQRTSPQFTVPEGYQGVAAATSFSASADTIYLLYVSQSIRATGISINVNTGSVSAGTGVAAVYGGEGGNGIDNLLEQCGSTFNTQTTGEQHLTFAADRDLQGCFIAVWFSQALSIQKFTASITLQSRQGRGSFPDDTIPAYFSKSLSFTGTFPTSISSPSMNNGTSAPGICPYTV